jgi:glycerol uptake facilitator-like aquaporin
MDNIFVAEMVGTAILVLLGWQVSKEVFLWQTKYPR